MKALSWKFHFMAKKKTKTKTGEWPTYRSPGLRAPISLQRKEGTHILYPSRGTWYTQTGLEALLQKGEVYREGSAQ